MGRFVLRRLFWAVFLFIVATLVTFLIFFVIPSNRAGHKATYAAPPGFVKHLHHVLHLDLPLYQQYWLFLWNIVRYLSLGYSFNEGASVRWILGQDTPITGSLVLGGAALWLLVSIPLGVASALRPRSLVDSSPTSSASGSAGRRSRATATSSPATRPASAPGPAHGRTT
ncbi:MAG: hypothetical protein E6G12_02890 [Actinobacteria bacterium]|nr:MAG: hypothetical protein E6G12_02890 [Actinomycetota bacterium]